MRDDVGSISSLKNSMTKVINDEVLMQNNALKLTEFHCTKIHKFFSFIMTVETKMAAIWNSTLLHTNQNFIMFRELCISLQIWHIFHMILSNSVNKSEHYMLQLIQLVNRISTNSNINIMKAICLIFYTFLRSLENCSPNNVLYLR